MNETPKELDTAVRTILAYRPKRSSEKNEKSDEEVELDRDPKLANNQWLS